MTEIVIIEGFVADEDLKLGVVRRGETIYPTHPLLNNEHGWWVSDIITEEGWIHIEVIENTPNGPGRHKTIRMHEVMADMIVSHTEYRDDINDNKQDEAVRRDPQGNEGFAHWFNIRGDS